MSEISAATPEPCHASWREPHGAADPLLVSVAEGYERWAPTYDRAPNPLLHLEERKLALLLRELKNKRVLDLACGTGRWLEKLVAGGAKSAVGVDLSAAMLRIAGEKDLLAGNLARADCVHLPFRNAVFDLAICSFALSHFDELSTVVRELNRVLKAGAQLFVTDMHPEAYARGWRTGFRDGNNAARVEMQPRSPEEIITTFHAGGFECLTHIPLCLGAPEEPIFRHAGKQSEFKAACRVPAVLLCQFRRMSSS